LINENNAKETYSKIVYAMVEAEQAAL